MPGVIDNDFRGEIKILLNNYGDNPFTIPLDKPISQLLIIPYASFQLKLVNHLSKPHEDLRDSAPLIEQLSPLALKEKLFNYPNQLDDLQALISWEPLPVRLPLD